MISDLYPSSSEPMIEELTTREIKTVKGGSTPTTDLSAALKIVDDQMNRMSADIDETSANIRREIGY